MQYASDETNFTATKSYVFPSMEMLSNNQQWGMKKMNYCDSLLAQEETGSKYTEDISKSTKRETSSVFSIKTNSVINNELEKDIELQNKIEVGFC